MAKLSEEARRRIGEAVRKSWAARRAKQGRPGGGRRGRKKGQLGTATAHSPVLGIIDQATKAMKRLTLEDIRPLSGRRNVANKLDELSALASDLRDLLQTK